MPDDSSFARLGRPRRLWAVAAIHGQHERLAAIHSAIEQDLLPGDRILYLGNYIGRDGDPAATIDELLAFRIDTLARPGWDTDDLVYLRGQQEETWSKLLQLQFAPNPREVLAWMLRQGAGRTIEAYGGVVAQGESAAREGAVALNRWTTRLRDGIRARPGHEKFFTVLQRAAFVEAGALFVHAGLDPTRPLAAQGDAFWWDASGFERIQSPYENFGRVIRGFDPLKRGPSHSEYAVTLDAGCGFGGPLRAAQLSPQGALLQLVEA
jgi:serine/threonine protein phosphatase 1